MKDPLFELNDIEFSYDLGKVLVPALNGVTLKIPFHTLAVFSGPSGSGKSTLLNILGLIEPVQGGSLLFEGQDISGITEDQKNIIRKFKIGFIFQHFHLIPVLTAEENVALFLERQKIPKSEIKERVHETLDSVGLWEHRMKRPGELSGGQKQRVAIARAVAKHPDVIIADEPTASLDQTSGEEVMEIFDGLVKKNDISIILTSHDPMVHEYAHINYQIRDGKLSGG